MRRSPRSHPGTLPLPIRILIGALLLLAGCDALFAPADPDADGDGYPASTDCNDTLAAVNPGAVELCDEGGLDENCNGLANDADTDQEGTRPAYFDADDDDYGDESTKVEVCEVPARYVDEGGDCNDNDRRINPGAVEVCDPLDVDEDCNGDADDDDETDPETMTEHYSDTDGDGWGGDGRTPSCDGRADESDRPGDCDDLDPDVNPEAPEVWYNGVDEDCDDASDYDADRDGYDSDAHGGRDCDDASADAHPGGTEVWYDGVDGD